MVNIVHYCGNLNQKYLANKFLTLVVIVYRQSLLRILSHILKVKKTGVSAPKKSRF